MPWLLLEISDITLDLSALTDDCVLQHAHGPTLASVLAGIGMPTPDEAFRAVVALLDHCTPEQLQSLKLTHILAAQIAHRTRGSREGASQPTASLAPRSTVLSGADMVTDWQSADITAPLPLVIDDDDDDEPDEPTPLEGVEPLTPDEIAAANRWLPPGFGVPG